MYEIIHQLPFNGFQVRSVLTLPTNAESLIIFSHSGNGYDIPHERKIAKNLQDEGFATLAYDFLHQYEQGYKIDSEMLTQGLITSTLWLHNHSEYHMLKLGYFGTGVAATAALKATGRLTNIINTAVLLSGIVKLSKEEIRAIECPLLFIVGEFDFQGVQSNQHLLKQFRTVKQLAVIPGASHLFEETGKMKDVKRITTTWLKKYLPASQKSKIDTSV